MRPHGTATRYVSGCRCDGCREANKLRARRAVDRMAERGRADPSLIPHGTRNAYSNWGCRCDPCIDAHSASMRTYKERRASAQIARAS